MRSCFREFEFKDENHKEYLEHLFDELSLEDEGGELG